MLKLLDMATGVHEAREIIELKTFIGTDCPELRQHYC